MGGGVGVEIREPLVVRADRWVREEGIQNLHYVSGNINVSIESLLAAYAGPLDLVSVSPSLCRLPFAQTRTSSHVPACSACPFSARCDGRVEERLREQACGAGICLKHACTM